MKVVIYSRVSTTNQEFQRQTEELKEYSSRMGYDVVGIYEEKISGSKSNDEREELSKMIHFVKENKIKKVLCWELSRVGRSSLEVLKTIQILNENCISLYIKNYNIETLDENCKTNPLSQFMIQVLTSISEMESKNIRQRIKSGYDHYRKNGGKVGRKEGYKKSNDEILNEYKDVVKLLKQGLSVRQIMKITGRSNGTIQKIKKIIY